MVTHLRCKSRPFSTILGLLALVACGSTLSLPLHAKDSAPDPFKNVKPPASEWKLKKVNKGELELGVKGKIKIINIGLRIQEDLPIPATAFLDQVRTKIMEDPAYQNAEITLISSQTAGGKSWASFIIKRKDQINQEFWARTFATDKILMVLYTTVGDYYQLYRNDFLKVVQQAAND